eukprot:Nk52_evm3s148 gene=Nk52_evmTU3s148
MQQRDEDSSDTELNPSLTSLSSERKEQDDRLRRRTLSDTAASAEKHVHRSNTTHSIFLPADKFSNFRHIEHVGIDVGGSLAKIVYFTRKSNRRESCLVKLVTGNDNDESTPYIFDESETQIPGGRLHFVKFETQNIDDLVAFLLPMVHPSVRKTPVQRSLQHRGGLGTSQPFIDVDEEPVYIKNILATGGGAHKFLHKLESELGIPVVRGDEMKSIVNGCTFLLRQIPHETFTYTKGESQPYRFQNITDDIYPFMLVNIGSGVSILKVTGPDEYERIGGTSLGGGTFWGLGSLLTDCKGFDDLLAMCEEGDSRNVDMLVGDIYGGDYGKIGLSADTIASSFGKMIKNSSRVFVSEGEKEEKRPPKLTQAYKEADLAKSLLHMISNNIGQIAHLNARLHNLKRIYFGGYFIRGHPYTMHTISYAINFWTKGESQALFLRHEGYLGVVGAFIGKAYTAGMSSSPLNLSLGSLSCDVAGMSGSEEILGHPPNGSNGNKMSLTAHMIRFPLLDDDEYIPDLQNLETDQSAREYWLNYFYDTCEKMATQAKESEESKPNSNAAERASKFKEKFRSQLDVIKTHPSGSGVLSVRILLQLRGHCLSEFGFKDPYLKVKAQENDIALNEIGHQLETVDQYGDFADRMKMLLEYVVAGNMVDWGAREMIALLETEMLDMEKLRSKIQKPFLIDHSNLFINKMFNSERCPYKKVVIFPDNSGADIVLGVFPLAREFLKMGCDVVLSANSRPSLNDVTHDELVAIAECVAAVDDTIRDALAEAASVSVSKAESSSTLASQSSSFPRLVLAESGSQSPCLDLRRVDHKLALESEDADLVVFVGMGRSIHTNYNAKLKCDCLKLASIKSKIVAELINGSLFDCIIRFDEGTKCCKA